MDPDRDKRLLMALSGSVTGFGQHIVLVDVCGLSPSQADALDMQVGDAILNHFLP
jgi:hypothetical protein